MHWRYAPYGLLALVLCAAATPAWALDGSVPAINGHISRSLLGDGTGVVIGIIDSGVDDLHPALAGLDSLGNSRMVAEKNSVASENFNTGDDIFGHGTWVASVALSKNATNKGMAPDARFVNARVLTAGNGFSTDYQVRDGISFAINEGSDVLNLSLNYGAANSFGNSILDLMVDWAAFDQRISTAVAVGNIGQSNPTTSQVRSPGSAFNGITVGRTTADFSRVHSDSANAFTSSGRMKPDVVAPGSDLTLANDDWEGAALDWDTGLNGSSFAAPHVAGLMAQQIEAGRLHGLSTDPLVIKATTMNSANKIQDKQGNPWQIESSTISAGVLAIEKPLDSHSGAGQVDGLRLAEQYLVGEMLPGAVAPVGWDFAAINSGQFVDYTIDPNLMPGNVFSATLTWYRHVSRVDNGNGIVDPNDSFYVSQSLSDLNLQLLRDGQLIAESVSTVDNVEHLYLDINRNAQYTLRVFGANVFDLEEYAVAWHSIAVPEPGTCALLLISALAALFIRRIRVL
jgi:hypothetical protein